MKKYMICIGLLFITVACANIPQLENINLPNLQQDGEENLTLKKANFDTLKGWSDDNHQSALSTFSRSCERILKQDPYKEFGRNGVGGIYGDWKPACEAVATLYTSGNINNPSVARNFFEQWFDPYVAKNGLNATGLFTGYYEASLKGSRRKYGAYQTPLYKKPKDLIMVELGQFRDDLTGRRVAGRLSGENRLTPYESRAQIESGSLEGRDLEIAWVSDPIDAFFLHIQGSGKVELDDGSTIRVGYDGQNGHPYFAIGRELVQKGELEKDQVSLQSIRNWMRAYPDRAQGLRNLNPSFIFFKEMEGGGAIGAEGVELTAHRSLAVDRKFIPLGAPLWLDVDHPLYEDKRIQSLVVAQDTGGAITGPVRGDVFWGEGLDAEVLAGNMKSKGRYWLLLPKRLTN